MLIPFTRIASMSPLTGDRIESWPMIMIVVAAIAVAAVLIFLRKK